MTGSGTLLDPYVIWDIDDLQDMDLDLTAYYELGQDIDATITNTWNGGLGFDPIGSEPSPNGFSGSFDGKGFTIDSLFINRPLELYVALFGYTEEGSGGWIRNAGLTNCDITGRGYVGALVGFHEWRGAQVISDCYSTGNIYGRGTTVFDIAGLLGFNGSTVDRCYSTAQVDAESTTGKTQEIGGLIGLNGGFDVGEGNVTDCYATGDVIAVSPAGQDVTEVGGLIGYDTRGTILRCYSTGNVTITSGDDVEEIGGFIGSADGNAIQCFSTGNVTVVTADQVWGIGGFAGYANKGISDCYSRGDVSVTTAAPGAMEGNIGGFVGYLIAAGEAITNSYSTGLITVVGTFSRVGGFCAQNWGTITDCFWDTETSGQVTSDGGTGKTTAQMKDAATFIAAGWAFGTEWGMTSPCNDGYPCLLTVTSGCLWVTATVTTFPATAVT